MHIKKLQQKLLSLQNISLKVNNEKNIYLINIIKLNQKLSFFINNSLNNKNNIVLMRQKFGIKNELIANTFLPKGLQKLAKFFQPNRELWIYLTEEQKYGTDSYTRYENTILSSAKRNTSDFIVIGKRANQFCSEHKFNIIKSFDLEEHDNHLAKHIAQIIKILYHQNNYKSVFFVINSNKSYDKPFQILPIENFNLGSIINDIKGNLNTEKDFENFKIYPNISNYFETEINIFLENALNSLIVESNFYKAKIGLVTTNRMIKEIDEELLKINKKILKSKREKEIEEIILITGNNKNFSM
ncbi:MSC_0622 family F1-like ATPase gamma subunit [Mycoplasma phocoeninasale]|uniref:ATP synthase gamma chain n=1 Tax=Mycoplasma phocoeninasale TaxID=2726117 RepID=A0A858U2S6_9MOLU|nr:hypothetical protein [Mycoplasma phocoeninasale]MBN0970628.1 hypothetical protein [Mycoplasma phocoeninasale]QJG66261.1 hypothetical protein HGG64_00840 [Mycoplasma phocoeninasale]